MYVIKKINTSFWANNFENFATKCLYLLIPVSNCLVQVFCPKVNSLIQVFLKAEFVSIQLVYI
jgi:hypothetical protein